MGAGVATGHMTFASVRTQWERALEVAGIDDFHWHDLRHTFNTRLIMGGVDKGAAMMLMNHTSGTVNDIYTHADARRLADKITVLDFGECAQIVPKVQQESQSFVAK